MNYELRGNNLKINMNINMNTNKKIRNCILLLLAFFAGACTDWLDGALPRDKNLAETQYSTVTGIHAALNGLYTRMTSTDLYGGRLTKTDVELLAHYYYYNQNINQIEWSGYTRFKRISDYEYGYDDAKGAFNPIWTNGYKTIFEINSFIEQLEKSTVLADERKNLLLGEAYGLRAFIHFDLFRLYGGIVQIENSLLTWAMPYNNSADVISHSHLEPFDYLELLLEDVEKAIFYLSNDPILSIGIRDLRYDDAAATEQDVIFETYLRNYRMNYYAVQALKARILMFYGSSLWGNSDVQSYAEDLVGAAASVANQILEEAFGNGKIFNWAPLNILEERNRNYIFYEEVIFGLYNPDLYSQWRTYTSGSTRGSVYAVHSNNLRGNIFGNDLLSEGEPVFWDDRRAWQWIYSQVGDANYISQKYERFEYTANNPKQYFQPLIRTSELFYIIAEANLKFGNRDLAINILDNIYVMRGSPEGRVKNYAFSDEDVYSFLETEHYKEFYGEGQAWFYLKRQNAGSVFDVGISNSKVPIDDVTKYIPPRPQKEYDFE